MPALLTHQFFGETIVESIGIETFSSQEELDAFLLGNQGPDPWFFLLLSRGFARAKFIGSAMHNSHINEEFDALRSFARHMNIDN
ncbi:MAG: hypothetical protein HGA54_07150, partial [Actinobacteria bacterium]|nr:hypothetical protein [Actinomycetota bacterium]